MFFLTKTKIYFLRIAGWAGVAARLALAGLLIVSLGLSMLAPEALPAQHSVAPVSVVESVKDLPVSTIKPAVKNVVKTKFKLAKKTAVAPVQQPLVFDLSAAAKIDRLINLANLLPPNYIPQDLVRVADYGIPTAKDPGSSEMRLRLAQDAGSTDMSNNLPMRLAQLLSLCRAETEETVAVRSGYRSYGTQATLFARRGFAGGNTAPGSSEHQSGLAFDLAIEGRFITAKSKTYSCFTTYAADYGFILSYPAGNRYLAGHAVTEPWHWRYIGVQAAQLAKSSGMTGRPQEFLATLPGNDIGVIPQTLLAATKPN